MPAGALLRPPRPASAIGVSQLSRYSGSDVTALTSSLEAGTCCDNTH